MALAHAMPAIPSSCTHCRIVNKNSDNTSSSSNVDYGCNYSQDEHKVWVWGIPKVTTMSSAIGISRVLTVPLSRARKFDILNVRWRLNAVDTHIVQNAPTRPTVEIPVTCHQSSIFPSSRPSMHETDSDLTKKLLLLGVTDRAEKDEIVKSVMDLKSAEIEEGYTIDAVLSRQDLLVDIRDKLLFEPEYAGNLREKIPPKSSLGIPWTWLPGALCLLQEVGEIKLVLDIGRAALQHSDVKPYVHDLLLSMALAECATAKIAFEKSKVSQGFEALARAQCLLRSKSSLGKITLLSQIEESLEELAPACTLELLGLPHTLENVERRRGAISALRELLRQGLDVETSCQVQDWPCFLSQALNRLLAVEIIDLLPWDELAITRKNKKSLESQNQRVVIDFNCFYMVLIAHIALGFLSKQIELINEAKAICECLTASEGISLKLEEAFCLYLLGQGDKAEVVEKLQQLELSSNSVARNSISGKEIRDSSGANQSLEAWLQNTVLNVFADTRDCPPSLVNFFNYEKKTLGSKNNKVSPEQVATVHQRPISNNLVSERRDCQDLRSISNSLQHIGSAVKQLAPIDWKSPLLLDKNSDGNKASSSAGQLKRTIGMHQNKVWESWFATDMFRSFTSIAVLGCIAFFALKLTSLNLSERSSKWGPHESNTQAGSVAWRNNSSVDSNVASANIKGNKIAGRFQKIFAAFMKQYRSCPDAANTHILCPAASLSSSMMVARRRPMPMEEAEALVKKWQAIKAEALGPCYKVHSLSEILDESMLVQWHDLADAARARFCYWRFVLLQLSVVRAEILSNGNEEEIAEIEAFLKEAAELVGESEQKNPNYYSSYKIQYVLKRQDDGSWRFCEGEVLPCNNL